MPGPYTDHHVHLLSTAAARLSVDVSEATSFEQIGRAVTAAADPAGGRWVRAWGYEEWALDEHRHPTRAELDRVAGGRPLVLHHRSGHVAVLNSPALEEVGEGDHPDGVLFDRHDVLSRVPPLPRPRLRAAVASVSREWSAAGIGSVMDATHTNGAAELEMLAGWVAEGSITQRVTAMLSVGSVGSLPPYRSSVGPVRVGPVKIMPTPGSTDDLPARVAAAHRWGYPVAVHVVEIEVLDATLRSLELSPPPDGTTDRIEHNSLCLPEQVAQIAGCKAMVVVNPGFLLHRRRKYEQQVSEVERPWLVRIGSLLRAGIHVRAGSDSPVTPSRPSEIMAAAMSHPFAAGESVSRGMAEALLSP